MAHNSGAGSLWRRWAERLGFGPHPRLQARLILAAFAPAMVILAVAIILTLSAYYRVIETLALERSEALTRLAAQQVMRTYRPMWIV